MLRVPAGDERVGRRVLPPRLRRRSLPLPGLRAPPRRRPGPSPFPSCVPRMREHFSKGAAIRDAVIRADLEGVRAPAKWLAEHPAGGPAGVGAAERPRDAAAGGRIWPRRRTCRRPRAARRGWRRRAARATPPSTVTPTLMAAIPRGEDETIGGSHAEALTAPRTSCIAGWSSRPSTRGIPARRRWLATRRSSSCAADRRPGPKSRPWPSGCTASRKRPARPAIRRPDRRSTGGCSRPAPTATSGRRS